MRGCLFYRIEIGRLIVTWRLYNGGCGRSRTAVDGFAGHCITVLLRSHKGQIKKPRWFAAFLFRIWSGKRGSNSRPQPWQGCALPLSYSRTEFIRVLYGFNKFCQTIFTEYRLIKPNLHCLYKHHLQLLL